MNHNQDPVYGGIDTHSDTHHVAVIDAHGRQLGDVQIPATPAGYRTAVQFLASWTALTGTCPIPGSSGKTNRHRLNRAGDRQANSALYRIAIVRIRYDQSTRDYVDRRITEGKTKIEAIRCIKRYIARQLYPIILVTLQPGKQLPGLDPGEGPSRTLDRDEPI